MEEEIRNGNIIGNEAERSRRLRITNIENKISEGKEKRFASAIITGVCSVIIASLGSKYGFGANFPQEAINLTKEFSSQISRMDVASVMQNFHQLFRGYIESLPKEFLNDVTLGAVSYTGIFLSFLRFLKIDLNMIKNNWELFATLKDMYHNGELVEDDSHGRNR